MLPTFILQHVDISNRFRRTDYKPNSGNFVGAGTDRSREEHGSRLSGELAQAYRAFDAQRKDGGRLGNSQGVFLEVEILSKAKIEILERKRDGYFPSAPKKISDDLNSVGLYVPNDKRHVFEEILIEYTSGETTRTGLPKRKDLVDSVESIREAKFETYWTDSNSKLPQRGEKIWWEAWCVRGRESEVLNMASVLDVQVSGEETWLKFEEHIVVSIFARQVTLELMLFNRLAISELRRADDSPHFYLGTLNPAERLEFVDDMAQRVEWPKYNAPAVCLLDTGVNRGHKLIEAALAQEDMETVIDEWGVTDLEGHGTAMAGLALFGNLTSQLAQVQKVELRHRLESIRLCPPHGFPPTRERLFGSVTKQAISLPEINNPARSRVFCLAITNQNRTGIRPTGWSSSIDQLASGTSTDDSTEPKRLIVVATGNAPDHIQLSDLLHIDEYEVEDPAQAWNALTVGGVTFLSNIDEVALKGYTPLSEPGEVSPFSRSSSAWPAGKSPRKPDIVMEAGNRAVSPDKVSVYSTDSLGLLTISARTGDEVLTHFVGTSASVAQASRLVAQLMSFFANYWPETLRALVIHSAKWTNEMKKDLESVESKSGKTQLLRRFGYGVPSLDRAMSSAHNSLALLSESEIQPFKPKGGMNECHYYSLPWPRPELEALGEETIKLKVTLSYFIEPNPGTSAAIDPFRYQSHGLRFELKRPLESSADFFKRTNKAFRDADSEKNYSSSSSNNWLFGKHAMTAGSLHCDEWTGTGVDLLNCDVLCVKPVGGWWNNRNDPTVRGQKTRYALVLTLESSDTNIDLHAPISAIVDNEIGIESILQGIEN